MISTGDRGPPSGGAPRSRGRGGRAPGASCPGCRRSAAARPARRGDDERPLQEARLGDVRDPAVDDRAGVDDDVRLAAARLGRLLAAAAGGSRPPRRR